MRAMGLEGIIRGKPIRTTMSDKAALCPLDHVNRQFHAPAPNMLWVSAFTYGATWTGFVYVAFVIDTFARRIVGWRVSRTAHASFVLDALGQALHDRRPIHRGGLVHHSDSQRIVASFRAPGRGGHRALRGQRGQLFGTFAGRHLPLLSDLAQTRKISLVAASSRADGEGLGLLENWLGCTLPKSQQEGGLSVGAVGPQGASRWRDYPPRSVRARSFAP